MEHTTDGCCGQQQRVVCSVTRIEQVNVAIDGKTVIMYTYASRGTVINKNGFTTQVLSINAVSSLFYDFVIEISFKAVLNNVSITCLTAEDSVTQNITVNSK